MGVLHPEEGADAGSDVLLSSRRQGHVMLPQVAFQVAAEVVGQPGLAPHVVVAQGPVPGIQICLGNYGN